MPVLYRPSVFFVSLGELFDLDCAADVFDPDGYTFEVVHKS